MDSLTLAVVGAAYGASLAFGLGNRARSRHSLPDGLLASAITCAVVAIVTIMLQHRLVGSIVDLLERVEYVASFAIGPVILLYVGSNVRETTRRSWRDPASILHFLPALAALVLPRHGGSPMLGVPIELVLLHQMSYTGAAVIVRTRSASRTGIHRGLTVAVLGVMAVIHCAQLMRLAGRSVPSLRNVVPVTISVLLVVAGGIALWNLTRSKRSREQPRPANATRSLSGSDPATSEVLGRLEDLMSSEHPYRDPGVGLRELADRVGVTPHQLSAELNDRAGVSLAAYLAAWRLEDARRRLLDRDHDMYTIEGIGEMSGFGSRSSFHDTFRRETGMTPGRYRRSGHDSEDRNGSVTE